MTTGLVRNRDSRAKITITCVKWLSKRNLNKSILLEEFDKLGTKLYFPFQHMGTFAISTHVDVFHFYTYGHLLILHMWTFAISTHVYVCHFYTGGCLPFLHMWMFAISRHIILHMTFAISLH